MPRIARVVAVGAPHHVTQRGNARQPVFFCDHDRRRYLAYLAEWNQRCGVQLLGYCLMPNHVHLVVVPETAQSLAKAIGRTHYLYTRYVNHCRQRSGHLWQNRYFSTVLDRDHLVVALRYVDLNPVRAGLGGRAGDYPWSSAGAHISGCDRSGLLDMATWRELCPLGDWGQALGVPQQSGDVSRLREATHSGRPCGSEAFVEELEGRLGRRLKPQQGGRPPSSTRDSHRVFAAAAGNSVEVDNKAG